MHSQWITIGGYNWAGFGLVFVTDCAGKKIIIWQHLMTPVFVIRKQQMDHLNVRKFIVLSIVKHLGANLSYLKGELFFP